MITCNYYELLEVGKNATIQEINEAYQKKVQIYNSIDDAISKKILKHLDKAYNTLTDNKNRRAYLQLNSPIDSFQTLYHNLFQKYEEPLSTINRLLGNIPPNTNSTKY